MTRQERLDQNWRLWVGPEAEGPHKGELTAFVNGDKNKDYSFTPEIVAALKNEVKKRNITRIWFCEEFLGGQHGPSSHIIAKTNLQLAIQLLESFTLAFSVEFNDWHDSVEKLFIPIATAKCRELGLTLYNTKLELHLRTFVPLGMATELRTTITAGSPHGDYSIKLADMFQADSRLFGQDRKIL